MFFGVSLGMPSWLLLLDHPMSMHPSHSQWRRIVCAVPDAKGIHDGRDGVEVVFDMRDTLTTHFAIHTTRRRTTYSVARLQDSDIRATIRVDIRLDSFFSCSS